MRRVRLRRTVEGGLFEHAQPKFRASSDDEGLLPRLFRDALGMRKSAVSGSGRRQWLFFRWVVSGMGREGAAAPGVRVMFHCMSRLQTAQIYVFMFCIICFGGDQNLARVEWVARH